MPANPRRIILDTNIWIRFLIGSSNRKLDAQIAAGHVRLLFSKELLDEFLDVIQRPRLTKLFTISEVNTMLKHIHLHAEFVKTITVVNACRDRKDNFLLSLCIDGNAHYLVTGDEDLLVLRKFEGTRILTLSEYMKLK